MTSRRWKGDEHSREFWSFVENDRTSVPDWPEWMVTAGYSVLALGTQDAPSASTEATTPSESPSGQHSEK